MGKSLNLGVKSKSLPLKLLIVRPDAIGDVVLTIPLINTIKQNLPNSEIYTLQQKYTQPLFENHPNVKEVIIDWNKQGKVNSIKDFFSYVSYIKSFKFDAVIFSYFEGFYAALMWCAGVPIRIGDANKLFLRFFINVPVKQNFRDLMKHEVEQNIDLFLQASSDFGLDDMQVNKTMDLYAKQDLNKELEKVLIENGRDKDKKLICIHPSSGGGNRAWLPQRYADLTEIIKEKTDYQVVLTGYSENEKKVNKEIVSGFEKLTGSDNSFIIDLAGKTNLQQLMCLVKCCECVIGTDTGPTHIAAAMKVPVISISPTKFVKSLRWGPWLTNNRIEGNPQICDRVCFPYNCDLPDCLESITPEAVMNAIQSLLEEVAQKKQITEKSMKEAWLKSSTNVGIYIQDSKPLVIKAAIEQVTLLKTKGVNVYLLCRNKKILNEIVKALSNANIELDIKRIFIVSKLNLFKIVRIINRKDLNVIHLFPGLGKWYWQFIIRQIAALNMYCPPQIKTIY
jgi:ADP-heptose:LPS heptosyltransferase